MTFEAEAMVTESLAMKAAKPPEQEHERYLFIIHFRGEGYRQIKYFTKTGIPEYYALLARQRVCGRTLG